MKDTWEELKKITSEFIEKVDDFDFLKVYYCDTMFNWYINYWDGMPYEADFLEGGGVDESVIEEYKSMHISRGGLLLGDVIKEFRKNYGQKIGNRSSRKFKNSLNWKYKAIPEDKIEIPNAKFWALHFLFLKSEEFLSLFCDKGKKDEKKCKERMEQILYFASELEKFDNGEISYAFVYEKLTGINVALIVSDYLKKIFDEIYYELNPCKIVIVGDEGKTEILQEERCEFYEKRYKDLEYEGKWIIENVTKRLLSAIIEIEMPYTRIAWVNRIFYNVYVGLVKMKEQRNYRNTEWRKEYTEECIYYVIRQIQEEGKIFYTSKANYTKMFNSIYRWFNDKVGKNAENMAYYTLEEYQKNFFVHIQDIIDYGMNEKERKFFEENLLIEGQKCKNNHTKIVCVKNLDKEISAIYISYILELLRK